MNTLPPGLERLADVLYEKKGAFVGTTIDYLISGPSLMATAFRTPISALSRSATMSVSIERTVAIRPGRRFVASILVKHAEA